MNDSVQRAAQRILATMKAMHHGDFTYLPAREADFRHLDLGAYRQFLGQHEAKDFRYLSDVEIAEISASPTTLLARTFIRSMVSAHGTVVADYYQVKPRMGRLLRMLLRGLANGRWRDAPRFFFKTLKTKHCVGYTTELGDGHFIVTSNAESAGKIDSPPTIDSVFHPYGTPASTVMEDHFARLKSRLAQAPGLRPQCLHTEDELEQRRVRMKRQKDAYREAVNWVSKEELERMSPQSPQLAAAVYEEVRRQLGAM